MPSAQQDTFCVPVSLSLIHLTFSVVLLVFSSSRPRVETIDEEMEDEQRIIRVELSLVS